MALSKTEINELITKLRNKYSKYAEKFNPRWFNIDAFEDRMQVALQNKMNLEGFVLAEISNFEKIKEKYDKKKQEKTFSEQVDRIIEENLARIKKYSEIKFHPKAGIEISYCYGAMSELALYYFAIFWILVEDKGLKNMLHEFEDILNFLAVPRGSKHPRRIDDHVLILSRNNVMDIEVERDKNNYLKECAFILHDIIDFSDGLMDERSSDWEIPLRFDKLYVEDIKKRRILEIFSGLTGYGGILKVREYAAGIISDFRLGAFKKNKY